MRHVLPLAAAICLSMPAAASAHAFLATATPAVGSTVSQPPDKVAIMFTEGVEPLFSSITVKDSAGTQVETGPVIQTGGDTHLAIALRHSKPGRYEVVWHVTSTDTHKTTGKYSFTVR